MEGVLEGTLEAVLRESIENTVENLEKIVPRPSKIEPWGLQNRAWSPPRRIFQKTLNLRSFLGAKSLRSGDQNGQLGSILGAQEAPKSTPKREKIDDENEHVFKLDFFVVRPLVENVSKAPR